MDTQAIGGDVYRDRIAPTQQLSNYLQEKGVLIDLDFWIRKGPESLVQEVDRLANGIPHDAYDLIIDACNYWDAVQDSKN